MGPWVAGAYWVRSEVAFSVDYWFSELIVFSFVSQSQGYKSQSGDKNGVTGFSLCTWRLASSLSEGFVYFFE